jgi:hypothetical protein
VASLFGGLFVVPKGRDGPEEVVCCLVCLAVAGGLVWRSKHVL